MTLLFLGCFLIGGAAAQSPVHFSDCLDGTEGNATIIFPADAELVIDDEALQEGDEVAVYTHEGVCAGAMVWQNENAALTVWGSDSLSTRDGLIVAEEMEFTIWRAATGEEHNAENSEIEVAFRDDEPYLTGSNEYRQDGIYVLQRLHVQPKH